MKAIFLVALLAITASASLTDNKCFMEKAGSAVASVASALKSANTLQSLDSYEQILTQAAELKAAYTFCNINASNNLDSVLENLGVGNLILSQCTQDLGGFFLILDSIVEDPKDIVNDIFAGIFSVLIGKQAYGECAQFVEFIAQFIPARQ